MSVEAITWALAQPIKHSTAKFVLVCLANCADSEGKAWPSIAYLCEATAQDRKTVIENLRRLKEAGLLSSTGEMKGRTGQVPVYRLNTSTVPKTAPVPKTEPVPELELVPVPKTEPVPVPKTGHGTVIEPSVEPSTRKRAAVDYLAGFDAFWTAYPRKVAKAEAKKAWASLKATEELRDEIRIGLERAKRCEQWRKDGGQFIPHAATWLNNRRWEDEIGPSARPQFVAV